jgi:hypothetical protein
MLIYGIGIVLILLLMPYGFVPLVLRLVRAVFSPKASPPTDETLSVGAKGGAS